MKSFSSFLFLVLVGCSHKPPNGGTDFASVQARAAADMEKAHQRIQIMNDAMTEAEHKSPEEARQIIGDAQKRADALR